MVVILVLAVIWVFKTGSDHAKRKKLEDEQDIINKANHYRDRLIHDDNYAKRVRDRFER